MFDDILVDIQDLHFKFDDRPVLDGINMKIPRGKVVCPSGALVPVRRATEVQMGVAVIDAARCLPHRGEKCSVCLDRCPIQGALRLDDKGRPVVQDTCTGCGICEYYCPTEPTSIRVRPWSARK